MVEVSAELSLTGAENRSGARFDTRMEAGVRHGSSRIPAIVTDLSAAGFRVATEETLPAGAVVWVRLGALAPLMARVVWSDGPAAGCVFAAPLHPSVMEQLLGNSG